MSRAPWGVYPRVCGGTRDGTVRICGRAGLSPRVRGNPQNRESNSEIAGSIPACAGEPPQYFVTPKGTMVYPRVCGGTTPEQLREAGATGLSPRVRGNPRSGS